VRSIGAYAKRVRWLVLGSAAKELRGKPRDIDARAGPAGWGSALALGAVLVYAGERYVVDLAAGLALALVVKRAPLPLP
jgi:hypothetical protein